MIRIGHLAPLLLIALPLAACDKDNPFEKAATAFNGGTPVLGGAAPVAFVEVQGVGMEEVTEPPCVDPGWRWGYCDEGGNLVLY